MTDREALVRKKRDAFLAWMEATTEGVTASARRARYYTALARLRQYDADHPQDHTLDARSPR